MKKGIVGVLLLYLMLFDVSNRAWAQSDDSDLYIFGFSQVLLNSKSIEFEIFPGNGIPSPLKMNSKANSFALHQVNLFFQKAINDQTTFFLNIEASGSYSSKTPSGNLEIPEGWISFKLNDHLELKTGLLLPRFNNLTEINNRLPLLPYLIRPLMYESLLSNLVSSEDYRPKNAYIQLTGIRDITTNYSFDYAFYIGNAEDSFLSSVQAGDVEDTEEAATLYLGENLNTALLYGSRFGIENTYQTFKVGISLTYDEENRKKPINSFFRLPALTTPIMGEIPRYRVGLDFSFSIRNFSFESEYMGVFHDHRKVREIPAFRNANLNKKFYYTNLTYTFENDLYVFGFFSRNRDQTYEFVAPGSPSNAGLSALSGGGGWRINDVTVLKIQYLTSLARQNNYLDYSIRFLTIGISTIF